MTETPPGSPRPYRLTLIVCLAEIAGLAPFAVFPALLPTFQAEWHLSHTAAGWISAIFYAGYMLSVPVLAGLTDRIDARRIMAAGAVIGAVAALAFAAGARGFWSALGLRFLAGVSLAGIYMPGLKVVSDHTEGVLQSRFVSFYTASFSIGASLSYLLAGELHRAAGWRWSFAVSALGATAAAALVVGFVPPGKVQAGRNGSLLPDFRRVLRTRPAMAYILGYAAHMWELFALRSWIVAFLVFSFALQPAARYPWSPTQIAFLINLIGLPSSICGNELSMRFGRRRIVTAVMVISAATAVLLGFSAARPYGVVVLLALLHGLLVTADSASLTAGAVAAAPTGLRGATLAVHSTFGFGAAFLAPLAVGVVLDAFGGNRLAWGLGFGVMALGCLAGPFILKRLAPFSRG